MRLGAWPCELGDGTLARRIYGSATIHERHRHRYEVNNTFVERINSAGLHVAARTPSEGLTEIVELPRVGELAHPWFLGVQFHPEFTSTPLRGHPLFNSFMQAALTAAADRSSARAA